VKNNIVKCILIIGGLAINVLLPFAVFKTPVEADSCVSIQRIMLSKSAQLTEGDQVRFGVMLSNNCNSYKTLYILCKLDGNFIDSGYVSLPLDNSIPIWEDSYWKARSGVHSVSFLVGTEVMTRSFFVNIKNRTFK
jgi:hypothetical protein